MEHDQQPLRLPRTDAIPVLRVDFADPSGWERLVEALRTPVTTEENSQDAVDYERATAYVTPIDEGDYRDLRPESVIAMAPGTGHGLPYDHAYLADAETFAADDLPLLCIDLRVDDAVDDAWPREKPFRVPALQVAIVEVNDSIANMFFHEFHDFPWSEAEVHAAGPGTAVYEEFRQMDEEDEEDEEGGEEEEEADD